MELKSLSIFVFCALVGASCSDNDLSDAYGQFEADEITISAEVSGSIVELDLQEGEKLQAGLQVGLIDTTRIHLQKEEIQASVESIRSRMKQFDAQADIIQERLELAIKERGRFKSLVQEKSATQQQLDQAAGQVNVLEKQLASIDVQKQAVIAELNVMQAKMDQLDYQIQKAKIINPIDGIVLSKLAEENELVNPGIPLFTIADLSRLTLRVYISGAQLPNVRLGQDVAVLIDKNEDENQQLEGRVEWISSKAEFTPKMIQTKEERVTQVYAVKISVPNPDGILKIGMPGEVNFANPGEEK